MRLKNHHSKGLNCAFKLVSPLQRMSKNVASALVLIRQNDNRMRQIDNLISGSRLFQSCCSVGRRGVEVKTACVRCEVDICIALHGNNGCITCMLCMDCIAMCCVKLRHK